MEHDRTLLALIGDLLGPLELGDLLPAMLDGLLQAVPSKWSSLNEIGPAGVTAMVRPHLDEVWFARFEPLAGQNPIYRHWLETRDGRPYRFCDVTTRAELEATELYREVYRPLGIEYQIAFALPGGTDRMLAVVLHRTEREYTDDERDLLARARPFLIDVYRSALALSAAGDLEHGLRAAGLTARQAEVVARVGRGASDRAIAGELGLSPRTVHKHLELAYRRLGVASRSEAAARAWALAGAQRNR